MYRATWLVTHMYHCNCSTVWLYPSFHDIPVQVSKIPLTSCTVARTLRMYNVAIVLIIACKVISGKCIHTIYHSTRLAPQCHAFHLVVRETQDSSPTTFSKIFVNRLGLLSQPYRAETVSINWGEP